MNGPALATARGFSLGVAKKILFMGALSATCKAC